MFLPLESESHSVVQGSLKLRAVLQLDSVGSESSYLDFFFFFLPCSVGESDFLCFGEMIGNGEEAASP